MEKQKERPEADEQPEKRSYQEPLLIRHEPLRDVTGQLKSGEKNTEKYVENFPPSP